MNMKNAQQQNFVKKLGEIKPKIYKKYDNTYMCCGPYSLKLAFGVHFCFVFLIEKKKQKKNSHNHQFHSQKTRKNMYVTTREIQRHV